jgi:hypothetical protein
LRKAATKNVKGKEKNVGGNEKRFHQSRAVGVQKLTDPQDPQQLASWSDA